MKSYFECLDELDTVAEEIHKSHGEPDHAIRIGGLELDYAMDSGSLLYLPEAEDRQEPEPTLEFTVGGRRAVHRYWLFRANRHVLVQPYETGLRKSEVRKPVGRDDIVIPPSVGGIVDEVALPLKVLTLTGLRRLTEDFAQFQEAVLATA